MSISVIIKKSCIEGDGVFSVYEIPKNYFLGVVIDMYKHITYVGSKINHSWNPTCRIVHDLMDDQYYLVSNKNIQSDEELTVDYTFTPDFIKKPDPNWN